MSFFRGCMRNASMILFWVAIVMFFATLIFALRSQWSTISQGMADNYTPNRESALTVILSAVASGLGSAVLPFIGAGLFWRLDRGLGKTGEAAE